MEKTDKNSEKKYFAFISYKREDEEWAKWIQNELENYHLPSIPNGWPAGTPKEYRPVFRDIDELKAGNLPEQIYTALKDSINLIVICSTKLADDKKAKWVNKEIQDFISFDKDNIKRIFPFIVEGKPHSNDGQECFPKALRDLSEENECIGGNINEGDNVKEIGRERAFVKVLAGMMPKEVTFPMLWNRYDRDKQERERKEKEQRDNLLLLQSRFVAEKASSLLSSGDSYLSRRLCLEILPKNIKTPERPFSVDAERTLRIASSYGSAVLYGHSKSVGSIDINYCGSVIVSTSYDNTIRLWDAKSGSQIKSLKLDLGNNNHVNSISFSPDGTKLVGALSDASVRVWDIETQIEINCLKGHTKNVRNAHFNPNCKDCVLSSSEDGTIRVWDLVNNSQIGNPLTGHNGSVNDAIFDTTGNIIISCGFDKTIRIWDYRSNKQICEPLTGHEKWIGNISVHRNLLVSASHIEKTIRLWDLATHKEIPPSISFNSGINDVAISHDGRKIAVALADCSISILDIENHEPIGNNLIGHTHFVNTLRFTPDDKQVISGSWDSTIRIWDCPNTSREKNGISKTLFNLNRIIYRLSFDKYGSRLMTSDFEGEIIIWDLGTAQKIMSFEEKFISSIAALSPDGDIIAASSKNYCVKIWDIKAEGKKFAILKGHHKDINSIEFDSSGSRLVTASMDKTIIIWELVNGFVTSKKLIGHTLAVRDAVFSLDGNYIASAGGDSTIRIWSSKSGEQIGSPIYVGVNGEIVECVSFSPDGKNVACGTNDKSVHIFDVETRREIACLRNAHLECINSICYSPDGRYLATASNDRTIRIWDSLTCYPIMQPLEAHHNFVQCVRFNPNKEYQLASACGSGEIRLWSFDSIQKLIDQTTEQFKNRILTKEELKKYYLD